MGPHSLSLDFTSKACCTSCRCFYVLAIVADFLGLTECVGLRVAEVEIAKCVSDAISHELLAPRGFAKREFIGSLASLSAASFAMKKDKFLKHLHLCATQRAVGMLGEQAILIAIIDLS